MFPYPIDVSLLAFSAHFLREGRTQREREPMDKAAYKYAYVATASVPRERMITIFMQFSLKSACLFLPRLQQK